MNNYLMTVESLQNLLVAVATSSERDNNRYKQLRAEILDISLPNKLIPSFIKTCNSVEQFWSFIKRLKTYDERRKFIWDSFRPIIDYLEAEKRSPSDAPISTILEKIDSAYIQATWQKAMERRATDAEGAITLARTLIESVCKHILDEAKAQYNDAADLPKLYQQTAKLLNLAPSQHTEEIFKQILGGCTAIVEGLGSLRNRLSDAHGKGRVGVKPLPRHAELAVNLSGALASYLLTTWEARNENKA